MVFIMLASEFSCFLQCFIHIMLKKHKDIGKTYVFFVVFEVSNQLEKCRKQEYHRFYEKFIK